MKTAIITGASAGLGQEFVRQLADVFPEIDCYWLIARRKEKLEELAQTLPGKTVGGSVEYHVKQVRDAMLKEAEK